MRHVALPEMTPAEPGGLPTDWNSRPTTPEPEPQATARIPPDPWQMPRRSGFDLPQHQPKRHHAAMPPRPRQLTLSFFVITLTCLPLWADEPANKLPEGPGLAAKYAGDAGVAKD